jgi:heme O synthase-like polyprenyltransferase
MNQTEAAITMIISIPISDTIVRSAQDHNMVLEEFVEMLIDKGMEKATGRPMVSSAIDRIRALRTEVGAPAKR